MTDDCHCGGVHDWPHHTPTGCATTLAGLIAARMRHRRLHDGR